MDKQKILDTANNNLSILFPLRKTPITLDDIEQVYSRMILSINADYKTSKGTKLGYLTGILYLAPAKLSGFNTCPAASNGCRAACLFTAGRGVTYPVFKQRIVKTLAYYFDKPHFNATIKESIRQLQVRAKNKGMIPTVRLNGTSDILWEKNTDIMQSFPTVQFYDYTKIMGRFLFKLPDNYHLTFSLTESNDNKAVEILKRGFNVAVVFRGALPKQWLNYSVTPGDNTDLRFLDASGNIIGLTAKGKARKDTSGFVRCAS